MMSDYQRLRDGHGSKSPEYRPEVWRLEERWLRENNMNKLSKEVEPDSGVCVESTSATLQSVEHNPTPTVTSIEFKEQEHSDNSRFLRLSQRQREISMRTESGFVTMDEIAEGKDIEMEEAPQPNEPTDDTDECGDLVSDVELPPPTVRSPEIDDDDSPTPGQSVYHYYAVSDDHRYLLAFMRPFIATQDEEGDTSLHCAVIHNRLPALYKILDVLGDKSWYCVNVQNKLGQTVLHLSTVLKQYGAMRRFMEAEAQLDIQDWQGNTPLHIACRQGDLRAMKELLSSVKTAEGEVMTYEPEDLNKRNFAGLTPMHLATLAKSTDCIRYLKALGADINVEDSRRSSTPLHYAIEMQNLGLVTHLVFECRADVNAVTSDGCTPVHLACGYGLDAIVALLVAAGADVTVPNDEGHTPEEIATTTISRTLCIPVERKLIESVLACPDIVNGFSSMDINDETSYDSFALDE